MRNVLILQLRRYTVQAPYKAGAGIGVLKLSTAMYDAPASFYRPHLFTSRLWWAGRGTERCAGFADAGYANPVQFTTSEIGVSGGGSFHHCQRRLPSWLRSQPLLNLKSPLTTAAVTTSLAVAKLFLQASRRCAEKDPYSGLFPEFCARNFAETSISVNQPNGGTRKLPCYQITRDGFAFLAMGLHWQACRPVQRGIHQCL